MKRGFSGAVLIVSLLTTATMHAGDESVYLDEMRSEAGQQIIQPEADKKPALSESDRVQVEEIIRQRFNELREAVADSKAETREKAPEESHESSGFYEPVFAR